MAVYAPLALRPPKISGADLLVGLVYHVSQGQDSLGGHLEDLTRCAISDSAASQRRLAMPWALFAAVLAQALAPSADLKLHPDAFCAGRRLVGLDGTQFSLLNSPRVLGTMTKVASRRFEAAFAKLGCAVLVELGTHVPLAAAIGAPGENESEADSAAQVLGSLPEKSLLLADRFYGNGAFLARLLAGAPRQAFLVRVSQTPQPKLIEVLADGSRLVEVRLAREEAGGCVGRVERGVRCGSGPVYLTRRSIPPWSCWPCTPGAGSRSLPQCHEVIHRVTADNSGSELEVRLTVGLMVVNLRSKPTNNIVPALALAMIRTRWKDTLPSEKTVRPRNPTLPCEPPPSISPYSASAQPLPP